MANRNWTNKGNVYAYHARPCRVEVSFTVDPSNVNGLGVSNKVSAGMVSNVFMHTSSTPGTHNGYLNPNPANGIILVQFKDNYQHFIDVTTQIGSALSATQTTTTAHSPFVIASLGTATLAQWQAVGLPVGITPAVGAAFIATTTGTIGGSATVSGAASGGSGIDHVEVLGTPDKTISPSPQLSPTGPGGFVVLETYLAGAVAAPAALSNLTLVFYFDDSSVLPGDGS